MPPVPLPVTTPNLPFSNIANVVPHLPNDPPSVADVIAAKNYAQRAITAGERLSVSSGALPHLVVVHRAFDLFLFVFSSSQRSAAAPPWFADALKLGLTPITTRLEAIEDRLDGIDTRLDSINHNRTLGDGRPIPFKLVPFPDGSLPSENNDVIIYLITCGKLAVFPCYATVLIYLNGHNDTN
ncbi:hypothetical protein C8R44DRAFT_723423 [Mycena epipterygia]|nr:hypothetical protein C8R44DRAFT_723423 [Mycena epipterygia]